MEQLTFSQVKKGNLTFKSIGTPTGVQGQTPIFSLTKDGETVKYSTDGVNYEILGGGGALIFNNVAVAVADFVTDTTYADYPYRAAIALTGVALTMIANVVFDVADATSGNYAPISDTYAGGTYIYAKEVPAAAITIPTIYVLSEAASGGASGNTWTNRGLWVANVQYNSYDIVYDNAGCYLCVADIASATAPEADTVNWSAIYKTVQPTTIPILQLTNNEMLDALTSGGYADLQIVTPEDDDGYELGRLYQFHIINDEYSWEDVTPAAPAQVQSNWNETDPTSKAFILNKPTIPSLGVPVVEVASSGSVSQALEPNTFYNFTGALTELNLTLGAATSGIVNEYMGQFTTGATVPTITWPAGVTWVGGVPVIVASATYQFSIVNNVGVAVSV